MIGIDPHEEEIGRLELLPDQWKYADEKESDSTRQKRLRKTTFNTVLIGRSSTEKASLLEATQGHAQSCTGSTYAT